MGKFYPASPTEQKVKWVSPIVQIIQNYYAEIKTILSFLFLPNAPSQMFHKVLNSPMNFTCSNDEINGILYLRLQQSDCNYYYYYYYHYYFLSLLLLLLLFLLLLLLLLSIIFHCSSFISHGCFSKIKLIIFNFIYKKQNKIFKFLNLKLLQEFCQTCIF